MVARPVVDRVVEYHGIKLPFRVSGSIPSRRGETWFCPRVQGDFPGLCTPY